MRVRELIEQLEEFAEDYGDETVVRLAFQPRWPFEHSIGGLVVSEHENPEQTTDGRPVIFIGEGQQIGYLSGHAAYLLDWGPEPRDEHEEMSAEDRQTQAEEAGEVVALPSSSGTFTREQAFPDHDTRDKEGR